MSSRDCMCLAFDADSDEEGWRPCPPHLCEVEGHKHFPDWLVVFARSVAVERDRCVREPGHVFCVMLNEKEATGLLEQVCELVGAPVYARNDDDSFVTPEQTDEGCPAQ